MTSRTEPAVSCRSGTQATARHLLDKTQTVFECDYECLNLARARRRQATIAEVLAAARDLAEQGLAWILDAEDFGARVGLHASSLYQYFPSKAAIYDALFAEGHRELQAWMASLNARVSQPTC